MKHIWKISLIFVAIIISLQPIFAQAPDRTQTQIAVLNSMSERFGRNITITDISSRQWFFGSYDYVRGLGCPDSPTAAPITGGWQRFEMTYQNTVYVYLISDNAQSIVVCNESLLPTRVPSSTPIPTSTPTLIGSGSTGGGQGVVPSPTQSGSGSTGSGQAIIPTSTPTQIGSGSTGGGQAVIPSPTQSISDNNQPTNIPGCDLPARLRIGTNGEVTPGEPNWVHSQPTRNSTKTGEIPGGEQFTVVDGPRCDTDAGMNFWLVNYDGLIGWTSEGLDEYWLVPIQGTALTTENISRATAPDWLYNYPRDARVLVAISPSSEFLLTGDENGTVLQRNILTNELLRQSNNQSAITALAFSADSSVFAFGSVDGFVTVSPTDTDGRIGSHFSQTLELDTSIIALALRSENTEDILLVVADNTGKLTFWAIGENTTLLIETQLTEPAGHLEFSQDGQTLIIKDVNGYLLNALTIED